MDLKIKEKKKNELLDRIEITATVEEKTIPSRTKVREKLSALLNSPVEGIVVQKIKTNFGSTKALIHARAYPNEIVLKKNESKHIVVRNFGKETKKENTNSDAPANFKK